MSISADKERFNFLIHKDLFKRVKLRAVTEDKKINEFMEHAIELYLDECEKNEKQ